MIVTIPCPSVPTPVGGVTVMYELANALARRGHEIHLVHSRFFGAGIESLDDIAWFDFEPSIRHQIDVGGPLQPIQADVRFGDELPALTGLPVLLFQGRHMFSTELEDAELRRPSLKLCVASWLVDVARDQGVPDSELVHLPLGLDHDLFRLVEPLDDRPVDVGVLFNTHGKKGWYWASTALEIVQRTLPDLRVLVFGRDRPHEVPEWIEFVHQPTPEQLVAEVYNRCRIFVQASRVEGFGFTAVEAMACGCALVTSDNGGSRDYAIHERTALVSDPTDVGAMAADILRLLRDDDLRRRLAAAGTELVRGFDWERTGAKLEAVLLDYVAHPGRYLRREHSA